MLGRLEKLSMDMSIKNPRLERIKERILEAYHKDPYTLAILFTKTRWKLFSISKYLILIRLQFIFKYVANCSNHLKVCLNRYSWDAGKVGSWYSSWFIRLECISWRFLTMSRLSKCLYHVRSCRTSSEYSKTLGNFLPLLLIRLAQKIVWDIFTIISSDAALPIFNLSLWFFSSRDILN